MIRERKLLGTQVLSDIQQSVPDVAFSDVRFDHPTFLIFSVVSIGLSFEFKYDWGDLERDREGAVANLVGDIKDIVEKTESWIVR